MDSLSRVVRRIDFVYSQPVRSIPERQLKPGHGHNRHGPGHTHPACVDSVGLRNDKAPSKKGLSADQTGLECRRFRCAECLHPDIPRTAGDRQDPP